LFFFLNLGI
jgi:hypothetical protein